MKLKIRFKDKSFPLYLISQSVDEEGRLVFILEEVEHFELMDNEDTKEKN